jgi:uncharacterized membrane protein
MQTDAVTREHAESSTTTAVPIQQWAMLATAAAMLGYGISRRSRSGVVLAAAAVPLAYRGVMGQWPLGGGERRAADGDTRTALAGERGTYVRESIRLERPVGEVYRFWRQLEHLPQFMTHLVRVVELDNGRSHWVAAGPGGVEVEWDAEIINDIPDQVIAWRSLPGADVVTAGSVTFATVRNKRTTQLAVNLQYEPLAGRTGVLVAALSGREPSQTIREDLRRVKQMLEAGEIPRATRMRWLRPTRLSI